MNQRAHSKKTETSLIKSMSQKSQTHGNNGYILWKPRLLQSLYRWWLL